MSLDSTEPLSTAPIGTPHTEPAQTRAIGPEVEVHPCSKSPHAQTPCTTWSYLFLHHTRVERMAATLSVHYPTYVHTTTTYLRTRKRVVQIERPTVSGLLFIQGNPTAIAAHLRENFPGHYLVRNCATGHVAVIPDSQMQPFMRISTLDAQRLRFLPHGLDYYAEGHPLVRIIGGPLHGMEGYILRIARDRRLVLSIGSFTLALSGIHKEQFENVTQYIADRQQAVPVSPLCGTPQQEAIRTSLLRPQTLLDHLAVAHVIEDWHCRALRWVKEEQQEEALRLLLDLLHIVGDLYRRVCDRRIPPCRLGRSAYPVAQRASRSRFLAGPSLAFAGCERRCRSSIGSTGNAVWRGVGRMRPEKILLLLKLFYIFVSWYLYKFSNLVSGCIKNERTR